MSKKSYAAETGINTGGSRIWLTIYGDLTTNLTLFFLILFAFTQLSKQQQDRLNQAMAKISGDSKTAQQVQAEQKKETDEIADRLSKVGYVQLTENYIKFTLPSAVLFDLGKAELRPAAVSILHEIALPLKEAGDVVVEGHTDNLPVLGGKYSSNWELSASRAFSVVRYLVDKEGLKPERFSALGYAEFKPKESNETEQGRAQNRRIEINIVRKD